MLTEQMKQERLLGIGGSDMPIIFGLSTYKTPYQLYLEKSQLAEMTFEMTEEQEWGHLLEPVIRDQFSKRMNVTVEQRDTVIHPRYPFLRGNIDGFIPEWNSVLEIKCANAFKGFEWGEDGSDVIPLPYLVQVAHYCIVTNADSAHIAVLIGGNKFKTYKYIRDLELEAEIIDKAEAFWNAVQTKTEPPLVNEKDLKLKYPRSEDKKIIVADTIVPFVENLIDVKRKLNELKEAEDKARFEIMGYMKDNDCLTDANDNVIITWKSNKNGIRQFKPKGV